VSGFVALGTLMSVGLMMLPAIAARHFAASLAGQVRTSVLLAVLASIGGLLLSYHVDIPAGPAIVLSAGSLWLAGLAFGPCESLLRGMLAGLRPGEVLAP
jgi:zinc/manganese transport system permease protein